MPTRPIRRFAATLALLGVVFSALWPLATHARPKALGVPTVVCVNGGMQVVHVDLGQPVGGGRMQPHEHCALCLGAIEPVALAATPAVVLELTAPAVIAPSVVAAPPRAHPVERPPSQAPPTALAS